MKLDNLLAMKIVWSIFYDKGWNFSIEVKGQNFTIEFKNQKFAVEINNRLVYLMRKLYFDGGMGTLVISDDKGWNFTVIEFKSQKFTVEINNQLVNLMRKLCFFPQLKNFDGGMGT